MVIDTHIDDSMGICSSEEEELRLTPIIKRFYKIKEKDTSKPFKVLGILVTRDTHQGTLNLSQAKYIDTLHQWFNMSSCNPIVTSVDKGSHLQDGESVAYENERTYQHMWLHPHAQRLGISPNFSPKQTRTLSSGIGTLPRWY